MIAQGAVKLDGERVEEEHVARAVLSGRVVQVGKRRFVKLLPTEDVSPPGS
jgi:tyrosyl-tRNA synthetase